jgi:hypothetical protein
MATCIAKIRRHFSRVGINVEVCSRQLLNYGTRGAMDQAVYTLIKREEIVRVVPGVFMRAGSTIKFSGDAVAAIKAKAFGKRVHPHVVLAPESCRNHATEVESNAIDPDAIYSDGRSTQIHCDEKTIRIKAISGRKVQLSDDPAGLFIKKIWRMGKENVDAATIKNSFCCLTFDLISKILERACWMPYWLLEHFRAAIGARWEQIVEANYRKNRTACLPPQVVLPLEWQIL